VPYGPRLTIVASIRVDALETRYNAIMMCDDFEAGELHWQISPPAY